MVDRVVGPQSGVAVKTSGAEQVFERLAYRGQRDPLPPEQVTAHVGHLGVEELVHPSYVLDPHDLQRWLEQSGQPRQPVGDTGPEFDGITVGTQRRPRDVVM